MTNDKRPREPLGLIILIPAMLVCCLGPILFVSVSFGGLSFFSGFGAYLSIGIFALAAVLATYFFGLKKHGR